MTHREMEKFRKALGKRIRDLRLSRKLTQEDMEDLEWLSTRSFQDIESGKVNARISSLLIISYKLGVELAELFKIEEILTQ